MSDVPPNPPAEELPRKGAASAGVVLVAVGSAVVLVGIIVTLGIPSFVKLQERARRDSVKKAMHVFQAALEAYADDHNDHYPSPDADWADSEDIFYAYFRGGDPIGTDGSPVFGKPPKNPYTGKRYQGGRDLFYVTVDLLYGGVGLYSIQDADEEECPFRGLKAPKGAPGTIVVIHGHSAHYEEYAVFGYGHDTSEPLCDTDASNLKDFFVLHSQRGE